MAWRARNLPLACATSGCRQASAIGYDESDIDDLVDGAMKQQRLLTTSPRSVTDEDVAGIFRRSMMLW